MDTKRYITKEDFLTIKPISDGGIVIDGRRFALPISMSAEKQLSQIGKVDKTGENTIDKVFFFEIFSDPMVGEDPVIVHQLVSAKIVDRYRFVSNQEALKEMALIKAKINLRKKGEERNGEEERS